MALLRRRSKTLNCDWDTLLGRAAAENREGTPGRVYHVVDLLDEAYQAEGRQ